MLEMDDEIAFIQLTEIDLRALAFGAAQAAARVNGVTPEKFCPGKHDEIPSRKTKPAGEGTLDKIDILQRGPIADDLAKPLDFAFGLKINGDARLIFPPLLQPFEKLGALCFDQREIAGGEFAYLARCARKRAAEIFGADSEPVFIDLDLGI